MEGLERLEIEVQKMNDNNVSAIFNYLKTRKDLYEKFNNEEKTIKGMYKFIYEKARKQQKANVAMIEDKVVYLWAVLYFIKTNEELNITQGTAGPKNNEIKEEVKQEEKKQNNNQITLFGEV